MSAACIGEPVSWPRLERLATGAADAEATAHLAACAACAACLAEIRADVVALPPLVAPEPRRAAAWWRWALPIAGLAAAAAIALLVVRPHGEAGPVGGGGAGVKGGSDVTVDLVRDRDGAIGMGATTFRAGDRWKLVVTCAPDTGAWVDIAVIEDGSRAAPDYPLPPAHVACGNRVVLPGAFELTGMRGQKVCAVLGTDAPPVRGQVEGAACIAVTPEAR